MEYNLSYDYCSIVALAILIFFYFITPKYKSYQNMLFGWIMIVGFLCTVFDALSAGLCMAVFPDNIVLNSVVLMLYQLCQHALPAMYFIYMIFVIFKDDAVELLRKKYWVLMIPGVIVELCNLSSPLTGIGFVYDENGYSRTFFYIVELMVMAFYMILCLVIAFRHKVKTEFLPKLAVGSYSILSVLFAILQYFQPEKLLICSALTISIFVMYLSLQSPKLLKDALEDAEKARKAAEEANEAKANFLANMSHEMRTPMNAICGMTYLLEGTDLKNDSREYVETIKSSSENLLKLINEILDFSKVDSGHMTLTETEYSMPELIKEAMGVILGRYSTEEIATEIYIDPQVPKVLKGDEAKVRQIIINLVNNAFKFTEKGQILISINASHKELTKEEITISVQDTGIGIKDEDLNRLFEQFEQVDMAKNRKKEGTGLGLAIVRSYCELMNGHVEVKSTYGVGSTFTAVLEQECIDGFSKETIEKAASYRYLILEDNKYAVENIMRTLSSINAEYVSGWSPDSEALAGKKDKKLCIIYNYEDYKDVVAGSSIVKNGDVRALAMVDYSFLIPADNTGIDFIRKPFSLFTITEHLIKEKDKEKPQENKRLYFDEKVRVALVDDNRVNLKVTSAILKKFGITTVNYMSGFEIINDYEKGAEFDLIFMDHMMPEMDGVETVRRLREMKIQNIEKTPIVALTANAIKGVEKEFFDAGMDDVLFKPVEIEALKAILVKWLPEGARCEAVIDK